MLEFCAKSISKKDLSILKQWYSSSEDNRKKFRDFTKSYYDSKSYGFIKQLDINAAWREVEQRTLRRKTISIKQLLPYAASVIILLSLGLALYLFIDQSQEKYYDLGSAPIIKPGMRKAILTLSDGSTVGLLNERKNIKEFDGTDIQLSEGQITYQKDSVVVQKQQKEKPLINTIDVPRKAESSLTLADGTKVWINSATKMMYPTSFTGDTREVKILYGEAYFEVAHNPEKPFIVFTDKGTSIKVLGTSFNVKAYEEDHRIETTLLEGKVSVYNNSPAGVKMAELEPGEQAVILEGEKDIQVKNVDAKLYASWKDGVFAFENLSLEEIMKVFSRWYDLEVFYDLEDLKHLEFTGNLLKYKDINPHLKIISKSTSVNFKLSENSVLVY